MTKCKNLSKSLAIILVMAFVIMLIPAFQINASAAETFGSAGIQLENGTYELPLEMLKTDKESSSMASGCVKSATITIEGDGSAWVAVELGSVTIAGITAYAGNWKVYQEEEFEDCETLVDTEETTDDSGNVTRIAFKVPDNSWDGVFMAMDINLAGGAMSQKAYFKLNYDKIDLSTLTVDAESSATGEETTDDDSATVGEETTDAESSATAETTDSESSSDKETESTSSNTATTESTSSVMDTIKNLLSNNSSAVSEKTYEFGSDKTKLAPGTYTVPVGFMKYNEHDTESMAADTVPDTVTLTIADDGTATITTPVQPVTMGTIKDMAHDIKVYQTDSTDGETVDVTVLETTDLGSEYANGPKTVPSKISFEIPDNTWDGVYLSFYVDAMGASPKAWLRIDYDKAVAEGSDNTSSSGVYHGDAHVDQFGEYDVHADVTVEDGKISDVEISSDGFGGTYESTNKTKIATAKAGLEDKWDGMEASQSNAQKIYEVGETDAVSGATYSSKAIRNAVMDALDVTYTPAVSVVPEKLEAGTYDVNVTYYTDIVRHYLTGQEVSPATVTVAEDGSAVIDIDIVNGTDSEPLYVLGFNGYYKNNDLNSSLTTDGVKVTTGTTSYSDDYFAKGTKVVTHLTVPLDGDLTDVYNTNVKLYVPVMNALNGEEGGIVFDHGNFSANAFIQIDWSTVTGTVVPVTTTESKYTDVSGHWAQPYIDAVTERGYFAGVSDTTFAPDKPTTRGEFVTVLGQIADGDVKDSVEYSDLYPFEYSTKYAVWAIENGIAEGTSVDTFEPEAYITREEMAVMLVNFLKYENKELKNGEIKTFKDKADISSWAADAIDSISAAGIMVGMDDGTFAPKANTTRAQAATIIYRLINDYSL